MLGMFHNIHVSIEQFGLGFLFGMGRIKIFGCGFCFGRIFEINFYKNFGISAVVNSYSTLFLYFFQRKPVRCS